MSERAPVVTIDGPSGAGKGTISQLLAKHLGWQLLDSGAIYRVLALAAIHHDVELENEESITLLASHLDVKFLTGNEKDPVQVILEGEDVTTAIRTQECSNAASKVAAFPRVREALLRRQRAFRTAPGLIADGDAGFNRFLLKNGFLNRKITQVSLKITKILNIMGEIVN